MRRLILVNTNTLTRNPQNYRALPKDFISWYGRWPFFFAIGAEISSGSFA